MFQYDFFNTMSGLIKFTLKKKEVRDLFLCFLLMFSLGRVVLYIVFWDFPLPKILAKNLVKNLAKKLRGRLLWCIRLSYQETNASDSLS